MKPASKNKKDKSKSKNSKSGKIVSSAHLADDGSVALSEFEYGLIFYSMIVH